MSDDHGSYRGHGSHDDWCEELPFELRMNGHTRLFADRTCHYDPLVIMQMEGRLSKGHGDPDVRRVLEGTRVELQVSHKPVWHATAAMITSFDSVLESRLASIESMLLHLMALEAPEGSREAVLRDAMTRLGWKPSLDSRRLLKPIVVMMIERYVLQVDTLTDLPCDVDWTCVLRGTKGLPIA